MIDRGWAFYPALRHALAFASGIALAGLLVPPASIVLGVLALALAAAALAIARDRPRMLAAILPTIVALAAMLQTRPGAGLFDSLEGMLIRRGEIVGRIVSDPVERTGHLEITVACDSVIYRSSSFRPGSLALVVIDDTAGVAGLAPRAGDHISAVGAVKRPAARESPWEPDMSGFMKSRGIGLSVEVRSSRSIYLFSRGDLSLLERLVVGCRRVAREFGAMMVGGEEGDLVVALLVGERTAVDPETRDAFMRTGTIHVLAVSGLHVGLIALVLGVGLSWIPNRAMQLPLFLAAIGFYVAIVGGGSSILRAAVMGGAFMAARLVGRKSRSLNTLGFSALVVLALDPSQLYDIGFQLSFGSVAGIILLAGALRSPTPARPPRGFPGLALRGLASALWLSASAQLFTLPLLLHHFGSVPTLSLPANLLVVPLTTAALGAGLAGSIVLPILPWLAGLFGASAYLATAAALEVVRWSAELPPGSIEIPTISLESMLLLLGTLVVVALARSRRQLLFRGGIWALLLSMTLAIEARADRLRNESASILFWYRSKEGSSIARVEEDTLRIYTAVARAAGRSEEMLRRRMGARAVVVIALDSTATDTNDIEPMLINETPAEFLLGNPGVILSCSAQPAPAVVTIDGRQILRLPLGRSPERAMIFRAGARWEVIQWR